MQKILVDTNLLLDDPRILKKLSVEYDKVVIPLTVLKELDRHKFNPDLSYSARNAIHAILDFKDRSADKLVLTQEDTEFSDNDSKILEAAIREDAAIATKDISMSLIADAKGVETRLYDVVVNHLFDPYIDITFKDLFDECETFSYAAKFIDEDYDEMIRLFGKVHGKKISVDAWFFVFLRDLDKSVIYANNPLTNELVRIDNVPNYRELNIDGTAIKAMDEYQVCAFYALVEAPNVVLTGKWGSGKTLLGTAYSLARAKRKAFITRPPIGINKKYDLGFMPGPQPLDAKILTPTGWTTMGEVQKGDYVIGDDGKKAKVLEVYDKGVKPVYRIKTTNGSETRACGDHIWATKTCNELKHTKDFKLRSTLEIKKSLYNPNKGPKYNHSLPKNDIVEFNCEKILPIPPYTLGVLLGDGSFSGSVSFSTCDDEIVERVRSEIKEYSMMLTKHGIYYTVRGDYSSNKPPKSVRIQNISTGENTVFNSVSEASACTGVNRTTLNSRCVKNLVIDNKKYFFMKADRWQNYIKNSLYELGLEGTRAHNKFVPDMYKYTSIENRIAILQGLMDTYGTIKTSTGSMSFTTVSKYLAKDVVELTRSLGINSTFYIRDRIGGINVRPDGTKIISRRVIYEVTIPKSNQINLFYLKRKLEKCTPPVKNTHVKIKDIQYSGDEKVRCIKIDNKSSLYITDDYIVTHNTKEDKMLDWFAGFLSSLYFIYSNTRGQKASRDVEYDHVKDVLFREKFETVPLNAVQGMSLLEDDVLIVDEVQLIDIDYLSMLLSRGGVGSKVILLGDSGQSYGVVKPSESGLLKLLRLLPHPSLAYVNLQKSYRSNLLELADKLQDNILKL